MSFRYSACYSSQNYLAGEPFPQSLFWKYTLQKANFRSVWFLLLLQTLLEPCCLMKHFLVHHHSLRTVPNPSGRGCASSPTALCKYWYHSLSNRSVSLKDFPCVPFYFTVGPFGSGNVLYVQGSKDAHENPWSLHNVWPKGVSPRQGGKEKGTEGGREGRGKGGKEKRTRRQVWLWLKRSQTQGHKLTPDQSQLLWASFPPQPNKAENMCPRFFLGLMEGSNEITNADAACNCKVLGWYKIAS